MNLSTLRITEHAHLDLYFYFSSIHFTKPGLKRRSYVLWLMNMRKIHINLAKLFSRFTLVHEPILFTILALCIFLPVHNKNKLYYSKSSLSLSLVCEVVMKGNLRNILIPFAFEFYPSWFGFNNSWSLLLNSNGFSLYGWKETIFEVLGLILFFYLILSRRLVLDFELHFFMFCNLELGF